MNCGICDELRGVPPKDCGESYGALVTSGANVLASTADHVLLPSVGPLTDSHLMIVPRTHSNSFLSVERRSLSEALRLIKALRLFAKETHGTELIFFESGAGRHINASGGCVYHAHLHLLPYSSRFAERLTSELSLEHISAAQLQERADVQAGYVWYSPDESSHFLCNKPLLPSQFLRYIYAETTSAPAQWNWRRHPNAKGVGRVIDNYRQFAAWAEKNHAL